MRGEILRWNPALPDSFYSHFHFLLLTSQLGFTPKIGSSVPKLYFWDSASTKSSGARYLSVIKHFLQPKRNALNPTADNRLLITASVPGDR